MAKLIAQSRFKANGHLYMKGDEVITDNPSSYIRLGNFKLVDSGSNEAINKPEPTPEPKVEEKTNTEEIRDEELDDNEDSNDNTNNIERKYKKKKRKRNNQY